MKNGVYELVDEKSIITLVIMVSLVTPEKNFWVGGFSTATW